MLGDLAAAQLAGGGTQPRMARINGKNGPEISTPAAPGSIGPGPQLRSPVARAELLITRQLASKVVESSLQLTEKCSGRRPDQ